MKFLITEKQLRLIEDIELKSRAAEQEKESIKFYSDKILKGDIIENEPFPENVIKNLSKEILQKYVDFYVEEMKYDIGGFLDIMEENGFDDEEWVNPVENIFNFLPNNIKNLYVNEKLKREDWLTIEEFKYINDDLKKEYIKNRSILFDDEYDILSDNMKKWYIDYKLSDGYKFQSISDKFFNEFSDEQKLKYFNLMKSNKFYPKYEDFTPHQKEYFRSKQLLENKINLKSRIDIIKKEKEKFIQNILKGKDFNDISANDLEVILNIDEEKGEEILNKICNELSIFEPYIKKYGMIDRFLYIIYFRKIEPKIIHKNIKTIPSITLDDKYFYFFDGKEAKIYRKEFKTIGELINYIKTNNQVNETINLKSRGKEQSEERNMFAKEILNKDILDVKQIEYNILKSEEKKEIIQKFINFLKKEFKIKVGYGTITHDLDNVNFSYFLEKKDLYYKFYNLEDFFMFSIGILTKTRQEFSDIVQASETPFKTISNLIKLSIEKYLKNES